jgi:hypothetical protein
MTRAPREAGVAFSARNLGLDHGLQRLLGRGAARLGPVVGGTRGGLLRVIDPPFGGALHFCDPDGIALALFWERPAPS